MKYQETALFKDKEFRSLVEDAITSKSIHMFSVRHTLNLVQDRLEDIQDLTDDSIIRGGLQEVDMVIDGVNKLLEDYFNNLFDGNWWKDLRDSKKVDEYNRKFRDECANERATIEEEG